MRRAEITILTIIYTLILTIGSMYAEKEYGITIRIEKSFDTNESNNVIIL